ETAYHHFGAMLQVAGLLYPGRARQFDAPRRRQEPEHRFGVPDGKIAHLPWARAAKARCGRIGDDCGHVRVDEDIQTAEVRRPVSIMAEDHPIGDQSVLAYVSAYLG